MMNTPNQTDQFEHVSGPERARQELERFTHNEGLDTLAALYGTEHLSEDTTARLHELQDLSATYWNFRQGAERQATSFDVAGELGQEGSPAWNTIFDAAAKLGQIESSKPINQHPDYLVILGGANRAPEQRLAYGLDAVADFDTLVYMGSSRVVSEAERQKASSYLPESIKQKENLTEYDLGRGAFETRLPNMRLVSNNETVRYGDTWAWSEYEFEFNGTTKTAFVLNTPINIHDSDVGTQTHRATTYDNYRFFADQAELAVSPDVSVVAVTTGMYVPGQHLPAIQELTLPYGTHVETIGHSADYSGTKRLPSQLLQEDKAAIDAAVRLNTALEAIA